MTSMFINLTPHTVNIVNGPSIPSTGIARCSTTSTNVGEHEGITLTCVTYGAVEGLPEPQEGVIYIVSALVRAAVPNRRDVASPGELARDSAGNVIGCRNLVVNG